MKGKVSKLVALMIAVALVATLSTACDGKKEATTGDTSTQKNKETQAATQSTVTNDPLAKYEPKADKTYEISYLISAYAQVNTETSEVVKKYNELFNIKLTPVYVDVNKWDELLNLKFASNEIPDVIYCKSTDRLSKYVSQKLLVDVPMEVIQKYAPDLVNTIDGEATPLAWNVAKMDGKLFGIPFLVGSNKYRDPVIWRTDWLAKVGISKVPDTINEFEEAFTKFVNNDPDGNNKNDTYGLSQAGFCSIFGAFGVICYPFDNNPSRVDKVFWKEKDGSLVYGAVQPEAKEALKLLAKWYKDGLIDPEFVTGESKGGNANISSDLVNGRIGYTSLGMYYNYHKKADVIMDKDGSAITELLKINPNATIAYGFPPIGPDGMTRGIGKQSQAPGITYTFSKNLGNEPDKLGKILQMFNWPASNKENWIFNWGGMEGKSFQYEEKDGYRYPIRKAPYNEAAKASEEGIGIFFYEANLESTKPMFPPYYAYHDKIGNDKYGVENILRAPLPSSTKYASELDKMREEAYFKIITGEKPIDYFDEFVANWNKAGGEQLVKEANEWYNGIK